MCFALAGPWLVAQALALTLAIATASARTCGIDRLIARLLSMLEATAFAPRLSEESRHRAAASSQLAASLWWPRPPCQTTRTDGERRRTSPAASLSPAGLRSRPAV